jgi:uncharacterized protein with FMN-binding domain
MTRRTTRILPAAVIAAAAAGALAGNGQHLHVSDALAAKAKSSATTKTVKGPIEDTRWGPVQAVLKIKNKKITKVKIGTQPENPRSEFIQSQAVPILVHETLQAQSAVIDEVSGATDISQGYIASLQSAIKKAQKTKLLAK